MHGMTYETKTVPISKVLRVPSLPMLTVTIGDTRRAIVVMLDGYFTHHRGLELGEYLTNRDGKTTRKGKGQRSASHKDIVAQIIGEKHGERLQDSISECKKERQEAWEASEVNRSWTHRI